MAGGRHGGGATWRAGGRGQGRREQGQREEEEEVGLGGGDRNEGISCVTSGNSG